MTETEPLITEWYPEYPPDWADAFGEDDFGIFAECEVRGVTFVWRWIPPGDFLMGSADSDAAAFDREKPQHRVWITRGFWMGETPVTQAQWETVMEANPSNSKGPQLPVEQVDWFQSVAFAKQLNALVPGLSAALPTEAQWEYACRAGTGGAYHFDGSVCSQPGGLDPVLDRLGWFDKNSESGTHEVKQKQANAWGLYDMHGNVWEWCRDAWDDKVYRSRRDGVSDPENTLTSKDALHIVRGGSWFNVARDCRSAIRDGCHPSNHWHDQGLRLSAGQEPGAAEPPGAERP